MDHWRDGYGYRGRDRGHGKDKSSRGNMIGGCQVSEDELRHDEEQIQLEKYADMADKLFEDRITRLVEDFLGSLSETDYILDGIAGGTPQEISALLEAVNRRDELEIGKIVLLLTTSLITRCVRNA